MSDDNGTNNWPQILKFLFDSANSNDLQLKHSALLILSSVPGVFGSEQNKYLDVIKQMLCHYLCENTTEEVFLKSIQQIND